MWPGLLYIVKVIFLVISVLVFSNKLEGTRIHIHGLIHLLGYFKLSLKVVQELLVL